MTQLVKLSGKQLALSLEALNNKLISPWVINERPALVKELIFDDFKQAWTFMTKLALYAESNAHHPEWFNVYNMVVIELTTHDVDGISELDFAFARFVEEAV
ncbi:MAG: 4a-hydroxytetrahydrobiopterin dehydratase [Pseudomonadales bacterium]